MHRSERSFDYFITLDPDDRIDFDYFWIYCQLTRDIQFSTFKMG